MRGRTGSTLASASSFIPTHGADTCATVHQGRWPDSFIAREAHRRPCATDGMVATELGCAA